MLIIQIKYVFHAVYTCAKISFLRETFFAKKKNIATYATEA